MDRAFFLATEGIQSHKEDGQPIILASCHPVI